MRFLKSYKLFESVNPMVEQIKDRLVDLEDDGYKVFVGDTPSDSYLIRISNKNRFNYDDIHPYVVHLINFMKEEGYYRVVYDKSEDSKRFSVPLEIKFYRNGSDY